MADELILKGLDELMQGIEEVIADYPQEAYKTVNKIGLDVKKRLAARSEKYSSPIMHRKKLAKSWRKKMHGYDDKTIRADIYSVAPHVGLVDRGHRIVAKDGTTKGYVQGKHFIKTETEKAAEAMPDEVNKMIKRLKRRIK